MWRFSCTGQRAVPNPAGAARTGQLPVELRNCGGQWSSASGHSGLATKRVKINARGVPVCLPNKPCENDWRHCNLAATARASVRCVSCWCIPPVSFLFRSFVRTFRENPPGKKSTARHGIIVLQSHETMMIFAPLLLCLLSARHAEAAMNSTSPNAATPTVPTAPTSDQSAMPSDIPSSQPSSQPFSIPRPQPSSISRPQPSGLPLPQPSSIPLVRPTSNSTTDSNATTGFGPQCTANKFCNAPTLTGVCCPTIQNVSLDCCGATQTPVQESCVANAQCRDLGLTGACCPTKDSTYLDCCTTVPTKCYSASACTIYSSVQFKLDQVNNAKAASGAAPAGLNMVFAATAVALLSMITV